MSRRLLAALVASAVGLTPAAAVAQPTLNPAQSAAEPIVHLLAVADSNDKQIGPKVKDDALNVAAAFRAAFAEAGKADRLRTRVLTGRDVTSAKVLAAVAAFEAGPRDTVVVFVSGHGAIDAGSRHVLNMTGGETLPREGLLKAMAARNPRLAVLLTDVCSSYLDRRPRTTRLFGDAVRELPPGDVIPWATVEDLFFNHRGLVDVTAAEPGFEAAIERRKPGSYFTNALLRLLATPRRDLVTGVDRNSDRAVQWDEVLPQLRGMAAARQGADRPQQAVAYSLGFYAVPVGTTGK